MAVELTSSKNFNIMCPWFKIHQEVRETLVIAVKKPQIWYPYITLSKIPRKTKCRKLATLE